MVQTEPRTSMQVPLVDLRVQYQALKDEILAAVADVFEGMQLFLGPNVRAFEEEFAAYCRAQDAIGVGSGTDALILGLRAADVGPGDEVITVSHTFFADTEAIALVGATPVFVDVEPDTWNLDPGKLEAAITPRTKAIIPVHLCGQPADMAPILEIARRHKLFVLEDACQAHGAEYRGQRVGAIGDAAVFSFYCSKNLGGFGEGGALTTNDAQLAARVRRLRDHGSDRRYEHAEIGTNARLDEVQAAILRVKLRHLDAWNAHRQANAAAYGEALAGTGLELPTVRPDRTHVYHLYVVQGPRRAQGLPGRARHRDRRPLSHPRPSPARREAMVPGAGLAARDRAARRAGTVAPDVPGAVARADPLRGGHHPRLLRGRLSGSD